MSAYDRIIGHENIIAQLKNAITNNKVNHAYIFDGDDGSGKKMVAKAFAEADIVSDIENNIDYMKISEEA